MLSNRRCADAETGHYVNVKTYSAATPDTRR
jgi:hypothetical protein